VSESLLITLREGFEAALVVAIVLAAVRRSERPEMARWVWYGTAAALAMSIAVGWLIHITVEDLTGVARSRVFAIICFAAAGLLTWMIFWMRKHARSLKGELESKALRALHQSAFALGVVAFVAVAREGLETALFLISTTASSSGRDVLIGGLVGIALAVLLGIGVYYGSRRIPMRRFFQITGVLVILFAAGLVSRGVMFLQSAGDLGTVDNAVYNLTGQRWLTQETQSGRFLAGIFGWDPRPSFEQVVVYLAYLVPVLFLFFWEGGSRARQPQPSRATKPSTVSVGASQA
jgi:high-affinity iron transporter